MTGWGSSSSHRESPSLSICPTFPALTYHNQWAQTLPVISSAASGGLETLLLCVEEEIRYLQSFPSWSTPGMRLGLVQTSTQAECSVGESLCAVRLISTQETGHLLQAEYLTSPPPLPPQSYSLTKHPLGMKM